MSKDIVGYKLQHALRNLDSLPAMPVIAQKLLVLPLDTAMGEARLLILVGQDPQILAKVIGLANSPALGVGRKINGIRDAAMLLGMQRMKSISIGIATMSKMLNQPAGRFFDPKDLWTHSMTVAIVMHTVAQEMPQRIRPDDNQIYFAGLLHDIGLMALHHLDFDASEALHHQIRLNPKTQMQDIELELLGMTHGYIGAQLARHWNLPSEIIEVVEQHHNPSSGKEGHENFLVRLVNIAEKLLPDFGFAEHTFEPIEESEWRDLCIEPARANDILELVNELAMQVVQLSDVTEIAPATPDNVAELQPNTVTDSEHTPVRSSRTDFVPVARKAKLNKGFSTLRNIFKWIMNFFR